MFRPIWISGNAIAHQSRRARGLLDSQAVSTTAPFHARSVSDISVARFPPGLVHAASSVATFRALRSVSEYRQQLAAVASATFDTT